MIRLLTCWGIAAAVLAGTAASARDGADYARFRLTDAEADRLTNPVYLRCLDESGGVTLNLRNCAADEFERLDTTLNDTYRSTMGRLPSRSSRLRLRDLERRWLATRWDACFRQAEPERGGTIWLVMMDACSIDEMTRRIAWLERYGRQ